MFAHIIRFRQNFFLMNVKTLFAICISLCLSISAQAQTQTPKDTMPPHKNVVRVNITYPLLFGGNNLILGYERVVKPHQSFSVNVGLTSLPKVKSFDLDSLSATGESKTSGYNISADYRFYLKKENKFLAPRGIYLGPYVFYYNFERESGLNFQNDGVVKNLNSEMKLNIFGGGVELGYQFLFWKRVTLDLVLIGPGIASYSFKAKVDGEIDEDQLSEVRDELKNWIENKFPGSDIVWGDQSLDAKGSVRTTSVGFRYLIHVGYNF